MGTLVEAAEEITGTAVGEGEDLITPEQLREIHAVIRRLDMVM